MVTLSARRPRIGDLVEIPVGSRRAYAQYAIEHRERPRFGSLLRVLAGLHADPLTEFSQALAGPETFYAFVPLRAAVANAGFRIVDRLPLRSEWVTMPPFRTRAFVPGEAPGWKVWIGDESPLSSVANSELQRLPVLSTWSPQFLIDRLASDWRPEQEPL